MQQLFRAQDMSIPYLRVSQIGPTALSSPVFDVERTPPGSNWWTCHNMKGNTTWKLDTRTHSGQEKNIIRPNPGPQMESYSPQSQMDPTTGGSSNSAICSPTQTKGDGWAGTKGKRSASPSPKFGLYIGCPPNHVGTQSYNAMGPQIKKAHTFTMNSKQHTR